MIRLVNSKLLAEAAFRKEHYRELVSSFYDHMSVPYARIWGPSFHFACFDNDELRETAITATEMLIAGYGRFKKGMRVLDVGCGIGGPALTISKRTQASVVGIDLSQININTARHRASDAGLTSSVKFEVSDAMALPFADESFDGVYEFEAGCHMPDKASFIAECVRVLKPGARIVMFDWLAGDNIDERGACLNEAVCRSFAIPSLSSLAQIADIMQSNGCEIVSTRDLSREGVIARNWEPLLLGAHGITSIPNSFPAEWDFANAGRALWEASAAGSFIIGLVVGEKREK